MKINMKKITLTEKIISYLLANYNYASGHGLMHGKMGGVLLFFLYARYSEKKIYEDYAEMLMENIIKKMHEDVSINFETGLCGIGWCIEYMIKNKLINGDTDDILIDVDQKIMGRDPLRMDDYSVETGLGGILLYVNSRIKSYQRDIPFDQKYLKELEIKINNIAVEDNVVKENIDEFNKIMAGNINYDYSLVLPDLLFGMLPTKIEKVSDFPLGIYNGLTGVILKRILL